MATEIRWRRGTTAQHATFTGALGEITVDTDKDTLVVHDGITVGGHPTAKESQLVATSISNTPAGNIAATTVQAAINELDSEKQPLDATLTSLASGVIGEEFTTSITSAFQVPQGTNAQRPTGVIGKIRYNSDLNSFEGYTTSGWGAIGGGAVGGSGNYAFYENDVTISADYTITTNKNAMTAGPVTVSNGVTVTVPNGSTWSVI